MSSAATTKPDRHYLNLIRQLPLRPIRNKQELERAMKIAGHLATYDEGTLPPGAQDYLDGLTVFIEDYQRRHPIDLPEGTPVAMLKHLMEQMGGRTVGESKCGVRSWECEVTRVALLSIALRSTRSYALFNRKQCRAPC